MAGKGKALTEVDSMTTWSHNSYKCLRSPFSRRISVTVGLTAEIELRLQRRSVEASPVWLSLSYLQSGSHNRERHLDWKQKLLTRYQLQSNRSFIPKQVVVYHFQNSRASFLTETNILTRWLLLVQHNLWCIKESPNLTLQIKKKTLPT